MAAGKKKKRGGAPSRGESGGAEASSRHRAGSVSSKGSRRRPFLGGVDVALALLLLWGVWIALPARWWPVDVGGTVLALLLGTSGVALVRGVAWARRVAIVAGGVALAVGLSLVTALAFTASHVAGLYGPVGQGGALILFTVALLVLPYLVALPAAQLFVLARRGTAPSGGADDDAPAADQMTGHDSGTEDREGFGGSREEGRRRTANRPFEEA